MSPATSQYIVKSQLKLLLKNAEVSRLSADELGKLGILPLIHADFELLDIGQGKIIHQSAAHYVAQLDLYEGFLEEDLAINILAEAPAIVMCLIFEGNIDVSKDSCSSIPGHAPIPHCYICRLGKGTYHKILPSGNHKTLVMVLKPDWLQDRLEHLECLNILFDDNFAEHKVITLPCCRINQTMMRSLKKLEAKPRKTTKTTTTNASCYLHIEQLVNEYHHLLVTKNYLTSFVHWEKALALTKFVKENFTSPAVKDISQMASVFCISEKSLARLGYIAFGCTIHEQVIKLRMAFSMKLLLSTDKPVNEIAALSGYNDPFFFSKTFKKKFGLSPSEIYRPRLAGLPMKTDGKSGQKKCK